MKWILEQGFELYVPSVKHNDSRQYADGQEMLFRLRKLGLLDNVEVIEADSIADIVNEWDPILDASRAIKLPFLVIATGGEMAIINGYSGLHAINELLSRDYAGLALFKK